MLYTQWNYDDAVEVEREEAYEDGITIGKAMGKTEGKMEEKRQVIYTFLELLGEIPEDIRRRIEEEQDGETLKQWYMAASHARSFEAFRPILSQK